MRYSIDRFEGNFAILEAENGETIGVERARLPREAGEGELVFVFFEAPVMAGRDAGVAARPFSAAGPGGPAICTDWMNGI